MAVMIPQTMAVPTGATKARSYNGDYMDRGHDAEEIVLAYLRKHPDVLSVSDWRDIREAQQTDIDCAIYYRSGNIRLAEIKSDSHLGRTGNVLFEVLRINHTAAPDKSINTGWAQHSPAGSLIIYASSVGKIYVCKFDALRKAFQKYTQEARKNTNIIYVETDRIKSTINVLIPYEPYCKDIFSIYDPNDEGESSNCHK